ncbi:TetR/AcrR family transcriptional regulator [Gordonia phthalatica]|uniref:Transcriptional regulator n=1 Tax=Gordonia phthalatica TaxID=1136941 RepID=A0A0N9N549_9ACTN|nr:TetR/AcrR family transcriptional regulator [Gordonia phthalatica]ALG85605.1 transcriptional regulator [Gordonia phthalatica]
METVNLGRPRDERIDRAVLQATLEELSEVSYTDFTLKAVAARAGTSVPAIRRRWPSKAHLVHQAVFPADVAIPPRRTDTGVRDEAAAIVDACAAMMSVPSVLRAITGLFSELAANDDLQRELTDRLRGAVWRDLTERFAEAARRDGIELEVDPGTLVESVFGGAMIAAMLRGSDGLDAAWRNDMTDLILTGIRP